MKNVKLIYEAMLMAAEEKEGYESQEFRNIAHRLKCFDYLSEYQNSSCWIDAEREDFSSTEIYKFRHKKYPVGVSISLVHNPNHSVPSHYWLCDALDGAAK